MGIDQWRHLSWLVGAPAQTLFVILYGIAPWWRDFVGRALFFKSLTLMVLLDTVVLSIICNIPDGVIVGLYWLVVAGILYQLGALIRQRLHH